MKKAILLITFLLSISFVLGATTPSVIEFSYDFNKTEETDSSTRYSPSIILTINTESQTTCYYTIVEGATPSNTFEGNYGTKHEVILENLEDKLHKYYIQCENNTQPIMEVSFNTKTPIFANIDISSNSPLKAGTYTIRLTTSTYALQTPTLEYSFDSKVYNTLPLKGSGKNWEGHLIIDKEVGEKVGSFEFSGMDLNGKVGTEVTGDKIFLIDTISPGIVESFEAIGYSGEIELSWLKEEDIETYKIYKSESSGVDYSDYYKSTSNDKYTDTSVTNGKTYYYKILAVDEAGNIGSLTHEVSATALLPGTNSTTQTGLALNLRGKVDNILTEISLTKEDITLIKSGIINKEEKEKEIFTDLNLEKSLNEAISELDSLKTDVERYKLQTLEESELDKKLNSATLKIDIIKKKVPETITITETNTVQRDFSENKLQNLLLEFNPTELDNINKKILQQTLYLIKEEEVTINSKVYNFEITYLDGTKKEKALFKDTITAQLERENEKEILLLIPKDIAESASEIEFVNKNYKVIKEDPLLSFDLDTKTIIYTIDKPINVNKLNEIIISPIHFYSESTNTGILTGYSILSNNTLSNYPEASILIGILFALGIYLLIIKLKKTNPEMNHLKELLKKCKEYKKDKNHKELYKIYKEVKEYYNTLTKKEKKKVYSKIKKIHTQ